MLLPLLKIFFRHVAKKSCMTLWSVFLSVEKFNRPSKQWILSGFFAQCLCIDSKVNKNERKITFPMQFIKRLSWELEEHEGGTFFVFPSSVHPQNVRFQNVRFQNVWFQNFRFRNVRFTKRQVYKTSGFKTCSF